MFAQCVFTTIALRYRDRIGCILTTISNCVKQFFPEQPFCPLANLQPQAMTTALVRTIDPGAFIPHAVPTHYAGMLAWLVAL